MIVISLKENNKKICSLTVKGHANAAAYGQDLVCAGVSSIMTGALNGIDILFPDECTLSVNSNVMDIQVRGSSKDLQKILAFLVIQLETMRDAYPECIKMEKKEV